MSVLPVLNSWLGFLAIIGFFWWKVWGVFLFFLLFSYTFSLLVSEVRVWGESTWYSFGFLLFILSEALLFITLFSATAWYEIRGSSALSDPMELPFVGCFVLLGSSFLVTAYHHLIGLPGSEGYLVATIALGSVFVLIQIVEFFDCECDLLYSVGLALNFSTVGLHFLHVVAGLVGLSIVFYYGSRLDAYYSELAAWYWHFVDYVWIFVFLIVYVLGSGTSLINTSSLWRWESPPWGVGMVSVFRSNILDLPSNVSLSYFWCGGFMISSFLVIQILSGIILSFVYVADSSLSFSCVVDFTNEGLFIWLVRYSHIWGVSFIFLLFFIHMGRALYYSSYSKLGVWNVGFILYLLMLVEAFLGYILPWHQMSYWAATVITSVVQSVPIVGSGLYRFIVGGFSVTNDTLVRVFSAHVCLAFVIAGFSVIHLFYLHSGGSNNPLFVPGGYSDVVFFHGFFTFKDGFVLLALLFTFFFFLLSGPDSVLDPESFIEANPLVTPVAIKPEWYFLAYYAMLRSVETKVGGLVLVAAFLFLLWLPSFNQSSGYSVGRQYIFWGITSVFFLLTYLGSCHPEAPFVLISKLGSFSLLLLLFTFKGLWVVPYSSGVSPNVLVE